MRFEERALRFGRTLHILSAQRRSKKFPRTRLQFERTSLFTEILNFHATSIAHVCVASFCVHVCVHTLYCGAPLNSVEIQSCQSTETRVPQPNGIGSCIVHHQRDANRIPQELMSVTVVLLDPDVPPTTRSLGAICHEQAPLGDSSRYFTFDGRLCPDTRRESLEPNVEQEYTRESIRFLESTLVSPHMACERWKLHSRGKTRVPCRQSLPREAECRELQCIPCDAPHGRYVYDSNNPRVSLSADCVRLSADALV